MNTTFSTHYYEVPVLFSTQPPYHGEVLPTQRPPLQLVIEWKAPEKILCQLC